MRNCSSWACHAAWAARDFARMAASRACIRLQRDWMIWGVERIGGFVTGGGVGVKACMFFRKRRVAWGRAGR